MIEYEYKLYRTKNDLQTEIETILMTLCGFQVDGVVNGYDYDITFLL